MIERIGSDYGGWHVDTAFIPRKGYVISAGLGTDISFDMEVIKRFGCVVVGVDPTTLTLEAVRKSGLSKDKFVLVRAALWERTTEALPFSSARSNGAGCYNVGKARKVQGISLADIFDQYPNSVLLKMNVEGAEYPVWNTWNTGWWLPEKLQQILVRFHHRKAEVPYTINDTRAIVTKIRGMGFMTAWSSDGNDPEVDQEVLFIRH